MEFKIKNGGNVWALAAVFIALAVECVACRTAEPAEAVASKGRAATPAAHFDRDSAYAFVARQVAFGPRTPGSVAHDRCADYLYAVLAGCADTVIRQPFTAERWDGRAMQGVNIIACFAPENPRRVLLAAHWDSRPYADQEADSTLHRTPIDGANDGASGVGVLLEVARVLAAHAPAVGVDIVLFDLEDAGRPDFIPYTPGDENTWCKGSQHWAAQPHTPGYTAAYGILLDMVGNRQPMFAQESTSLYYAADILDKVWAVAAESGYGAVFVPNRTGGIIDDHLFVNRLARIPMIDIIHKDFGTSTGFFPQWHTLQDNMAQIDPNTLDIVGKTLLETLYRE
ncbi:MAG: M28 family peptidase [Bacteroidales bacterium]|nr:M28 family peptidase [Bacteroidales bacterium]